MSEESDSASMNLFQQYRHTVKVDKTTSRMKNKDWYRGALELNVQLHAYVHDDVHMDCYLHVKSRQSYEALGRLDLRQLEDDAALDSWIEEVLGHPIVKAAKAKSLGCVFYLADEISLAGLGPEHQDPAELPRLRELMEEDPREVLEDKTATSDSHAWRLFPYFGGGGEFVTAVAVSRALDSILERWREVGNEKNFPIRTSALSAPLCAVASLPWSASANPDGTVAVFNYQKFTLLAFFNASCELMMLRHLAHSQGASLPRNLGPLVFSGATSFELENPEIYVLPMTGVDVENEVLSLQTAMKQSPIMLVEAADILQSRGVETSIPLEMLTSTQELDPGVYPLAGNETFSDFAGQSWPYQDFLSPSAEELNQVPDAQAMRLLKLSRFVKICAALALAGLFAFMGLGIAEKLSSDVWHYQKGGNGLGEKTALQQKIQKYQRWDGLMKDRSKAWVCLEMLNVLVPDDGSMVLTDVNHDVKMKAQGRNKARQTIEKTWEVSGLTDEAGMIALEDYNALDGKKMKALFREVAKRTGNGAYWPDIKDRDLTVKFEHKGKAARGTGGTPAKLNRGFTLRIIQNFSEYDPLKLQ
ncbi:hypothetical protein HW115_04605 [Verrucomicrobiaceae bacterium N1E253]|uniref:Uncharacterized protein n=1 Tax=Oceaniferula marina TaxID=2748318 RepID=A0A851GIC1_9BACT|nr:hypothetical protein [Oceaniferula marina]NWK54877.1 hypothetical protein [Oceaniferula marina]